MKESITTKFFDSLKSFKVITLLFFILLSLVAINFSLDNSGAVINGVGISSVAEKVGFEFDSKTNLRNLEKILYINDFKIEDSNSYYSYISNVDPNSTIVIRTDKNNEGYIIDLSQITNQSVVDALGISVRDAPGSNIKLGIELEGGSRLILKPISNITDAEFDLLISSLQNRLDIYGASGTKVNKLDDAFSGEKFVIVESTASNKNDIYELISRQGEFVAKFGNVTVFEGDNVVSVFTDPQHSGLERCSGSATEGYACTFHFQIEIDSDGADKFFEEAQNLGVVGTHLSEKISFIMDGKEITSLNVDSSFKSHKVTNPQISVSSEVMSTKDKAIENGQKEMKLLQTILSTKSLPSELEVVQSYSVSSSTGTKFLDNAFIVGLTALLLVSSIVALRYRHFGIFIGITIALFSEVIIVFGIAAFMRLSIDLAAIGGLIAAIGTGVDDQVIITDEYFRKRNKNMSSKKKIKGAFYIIMIAYFTTIAAMGPLMFAGLKMLQGFAFMILIGVTVGVFITRPAYASILRILMTTKKQRIEEEKEDE